VMEGRVREGKDSGAGRREGKEREGEIETEFETD
jgi:hypothetical protein